MDAPPVRYATTSDNQRIAYAVAGQGPTLVRVPILWSHFARQWSDGLLRDDFESFAARFRFVLYDSRGQGSSTRGLAETTSVADYEADLEAVIAQIDAPRFLLFGPSQRGLVAMRYALRYPERMIALVLWNYTDSHLATSFQPGILDLMQRDWQFFMETTARLGFPTRDPARVIEVFRETMDQHDMVIQARALRAASAEDLLPSLTVPTLVLASRAGSSAFPTEEHGRWLCSRIPNAQLVLLDAPDGGLNPLPDGSSPVINAIEDFVSELGLVAGSTQALPDGISAREVEVLRLIVKGRSNSQIAEGLVISLNTVQHHVSNILAKTGLANRTELAAYVHHHNLV